MSAKQALQHFLSLLPEGVASQLTVVSAARPWESFMLHISKDTAIDAFSPTVTRRGLDAENRSIPRICVAPSLAGCIMAYSSDLYDYMERSDSRSADGQRRVKYRGGWAIYGIPYDLALRPSKKLLPDVLCTDEHWLVTYDEGTVTYKPELLGKFFYEVVTYAASGKDPPTVGVEMIIEVLTDVAIRFDHQNVLKKGYWKLKIQGMHNAERWDKIPAVEVQALQKGEYIASKQLVASMLSFESLAPASSAW